MPTCPSLQRASTSVHVDDVAHDLLGCYLVRRKRHGASSADGSSRSRRTADRAIPAPTRTGHRTDARGSCSAGRCRLRVLHVRHAPLHERGDGSGRRRECGAHPGDRAGVGRPARCVPARRRTSPTTSSASGPGRLCRALGIDRRLNGTRPRQRGHGADPAADAATQRDHCRAYASRSVDGRRAGVALLGRQPVGQSSARSPPLVGDRDGRPGGGGGRRPGDPARRPRAARRRFRRRRSLRPSCAS